MSQQYPHYFKPCPYEVVDLYRLGRILGIRENELFHAFKKTVAAGQRGSKSQLQDVCEAVDSLVRHLEMEVEDISVNGPPNPNVVKLFQALNEVKRGMSSFKNQWRNCFPAFEEKGASSIDNVSKTAQESENLAHRIASEGPGRYTATDSNAAAPSASNLTPEDIDELAKSFANIFGIDALKNSRGVMVMTTMDDDDIKPPEEELTDEDIARLDADHPTDEEIDEDIIPHPPRSVP